MSPSYLKVFAVCLLVLFLAACSFHPNYPVPNGRLTITSIEDYRYKIASYSQYSASEKPLVEIREDLLVDSHKYSCEFRVEFIHITIWFNEGVVCVDFKERVVRDEIASKSVKVNYWVTSDVNFFFRKDIENETIAFVASKEEYRKLKKVGEHAIQVDLLMTALHEVYHYLYIKASSPKKVSKVVEEFYANVFSIHLLTKKFERDILDPVFMHTVNLSPSKGNRVIFAEQIEDSFEGANVAYEVCKIEEQCYEQFKKAIDIISDALDIT